MHKLHIMLKNKTLTSWKWKTNWMDRIYRFLVYFF